MFFVKKTYNGTFRPHCKTNLIKLFDIKSQKKPNLIKLSDMKSKKKSIPEFEPIHSKRKFPHIF